MLSQRHACRRWPPAVRDFGEECLIYPGAVVREDCVLRLAGDPSQQRFHFGADGYGFTRDGATHVKIPQVGNVVIGDDVEIGADRASTRAAIGSTRIGRGTKIDNLVQIGHGCQAGEDVLRSWPSPAWREAGAGGSGDHRRPRRRPGALDDRARVMSLRWSPSPCPAGVVVSGNPARPHRDAAQARCPAHAG